VNSARSRPTKEGVGGESDGLVLCDGACRVVRPCGAEQEAVVGGDGRVLLARRIDASAAGRRRHPRVIVINAFLLLLMMRNPGTILGNELAGLSAELFVHRAGVQSSQAALYSTKTQTFSVPKSCTRNSSGHERAIWCGVPTFPIYAGQ
jgi:hypothetical protein